MKNLLSPKLMECTLRDGSYANNFQFSKEDTFILDFVNETEEIVGIIDVIIPSRRVISELTSADSYRLLSLSIQRLGV